MKDTSKSRKHDPMKGAGSGDEPAADPDLELQRVRQYLARVTGELEDCKMELREKEQSLSELSEKLGSKQISEKETVLERLVFNLEKAQEMASMGSWVLDVETGKVTWTAGLHKMFGQDPSCPVPTLAQQEAWYTAKSWNAMIEAVDRTSRDGSPYNMELETKRRDGSIGVVRSIGAAERDETGRIVRLRGIAQDISEIKETEAKLERALKLAKTAQIHKDQFLANMSHEIRTPMNGMIGFANLLREEGLDPATRDEYIDTIEKCSNQLLHLIDDIIDVAKIEAGEINITKSPFSLAQLIHDTATTMEKYKADKGKDRIKLQTHIPKGAEAYKINSDQMRIHQILTNLINNAIKFSDKGTVELGFELKEDSVVLFVKDEGIGIAPERADNVFERFEHLEGTEQKYEGTGLGLSISKGLAERLGGSLILESELGVGSLFRLEIPEKAAAFETFGQAASPKKVSSPGEHRGTILVVEDEQTNRDFIQTILKGTSFNVLYVENGKEAICAYREHPEIEVVVMDIRMPVMSGDVAAKEILKIDGNAKIIAQTAYVMHEERERFRENGFADYISKPYHPQDFLAIIEKWMN